MLAVARKRCGGGAHRNQLRHSSTTVPISALCVRPEIGDPVSASHALLASASSPPLLPTTAWPHGTIIGAPVIGSDASWATGGVGAGLTTYAAARAAIAFINLRTENSNPLPSLPALFCRQRSRQIRISCCCYGAQAGAMTLLIHRKIHRKRRTV